MTNDRPDGGSMTPEELAVLEGIGDRPEAEWTEEEARVFRKQRHLRWSEPMVSLEEMRATQRRIEAGELRVETVGDWPAANPDRPAKD